jgi:hypothetical protein
VIRELSAGGVEEVPGRLAYKGEREMAESALSRLAEGR